MIQPQPLLSELANLTGDDGLLDRFLVFAAKTKFHASYIVKDNIENSGSIPRNACVACET